jgi:hypothetical protein
VAFGMALQPNNYGCGFLLSLKLLADVKVYGDCFETFERIMMGGDFAIGPCEG